MNICLHLLLLFLFHFNTLHSFVVRPLFFQSIDFYVLKFWYNFYFHFLQPTLKVKLILIAIFLLLFCFALFLFELPISVYIASPASGKLGLRMTTLHEEPSTRHPLNEDVEENYSDSELNQYDDTAVRKPPLKSRFPTSKTMGSLRDIGSSYQSMCSSVNATNNVTTNTQTSKNLRKSAVNAQNNKQTNQGTPSMTSSTSSGYGSQVRAINATASLSKLDSI